MNARVPGIVHEANGHNGIILTYNGREAEVRPLASKPGYRYRAPGVGWTNSKGTLKGALRRVRRILHG